MGAVSSESCEESLSAGGADLESSPVKSACHSVVVSVGCPGEVVP